MGKAKESWAQFLGRLRINSGSAATVVDRFGEHLLKNGYRIATAKCLLRLVASFGQWLSATGLEMQAAAPLRRSSFQAVLDARAYGSQKFARAVKNDARLRRVLHSGVQGRPAVGLKCDYAPHSP